MSDSVTNDKLAEKRQSVLASGFASGNSCYVASAKSATIVDVEGREYIDFSGGIGVMNVGHSHPRVVQAIREQAERFTHTCFMVLPYEPVVTLADKLCNAAPVPGPASVVFINSGAEAVENAVKIARYHTGRQAILAFNNCFHGRTLLTMSMTSKVKPYKFGFGPFASEIYHVPYAYCYRCPFGLKYPDCGTACADYLNEYFIGNVAPENVAALIVEPVQGEGGFITPPPEYFVKLKKICEENGILFVSDEIQSGMGRTGKMFAIEHWNVKPDMVTAAKSIAAGMPLSAVVAKKNIIDSVHAGGIGGTYGGNPVACAAGLAVMEVFEQENLLERARKLGEKLRVRFEDLQKEYEIIGDVRGKGPMLALELVRDRETKEPAGTEAKALTKYCSENGLILLSCGNFGNVIRTLMPLVITDEELEKGMAILEDGFRHIAGIHP